ncbi:MAG: right-handed parallel beta-helix repeat-containing protein, partial [Pirellula sp.]
IDVPDNPDQKARLNQLTNLEHFTTNIGVDAVLGIDGKVGVPEIGFGKDIDGPRKRIPIFDQQTGSVADLLDEFAAMKQKMDDEIRRAESALNALPLGPIAVAVCYAAPEMCEALAEGRLGDAAKSIEAEARKFYRDPYGWVQNGLEKFGIKVDQRLLEIAFPSLYGIKVVGGVIDDFSAFIFGDCDEVDIPSRQSFTVSQSGGEIAIAWDQASSDAYLGAGVGADIFIDVVDGQLMIDGKDFARSEKVASCESLFESWDEYRTVTHTNSVTLPMAGITSIRLMGSTFDDSLILGKAVILPSRIEGYEGNDTLVGGSGENVIFGGAGGDTISSQFGRGILYGEDGDDLLIGGSYDDHMEGGSGADTIDGGEGSDLIYGQDGDDRILAGNGVNVVYAGSGHDIIQGGRDVDTLYGEDGDDKIFGNSGDDVTYAGDGDDLVLGGEGNDTIYGGAGADQLIGDQQNGQGSGEDVIYGQEGDDLLGGGGGDDELFGGAGADRLIGQAGNDLLVGADRDSSLGDTEDYLQGDSGDDTLFGNLGNDILFGGSGFNVLYGGSGDDRLSNGNGGGELYGEEGNDLLFAGGGDWLYGGDGDDTLYGAYNWQTLVSARLFGDDGQDTIYGSFIDDTIFGGAGNDTIYGLQGNDKIYGGTGDDLLAGLKGNNSESYPGEDNDQLFGEEGNDVLLGEQGQDFLSGGSGQDTLEGGQDADRLDGDSDNDTLRGNQGHDLLHGGEGDDLLHGDDGDDQLHGDRGNDSLYGGSGSDWLHGGAGLDLLDGQSGNDVLFAGAGLGKRLFGGDGDDEIYGADEGSEDENFTDAIWFGDVIDGGAGNDKIFGLGGADYIVAGPGDDEVDGGDHGDWISGGDGNDRINAGIQPSIGPGDQLFGDDGNDILIGSHRADFLYGGTGNDRIEGLDGNDHLEGNEGDDEIYGGFGQNSILGQLGDDYLVGSDDGDDLIEGGDGNDRIEGLAGNDLLRGGPGDDQLMGGDGDDLLEGGAGSDVLFGQAHHDRLFGHSQTSNDDDNAIDHLYGDFGTNRNELHSGRDQLDGNGGSNLLYGEGDDDYLAPGIHTGNRIDYGSGESSSPSDFVAPSPTPSPTHRSTPIANALPKLPAGQEEMIRWGQFGSSASGPGLGSNDGLAIESSLATSTSNSVFVAWADNRSGNFEILVARHSQGTWEGLSGSANARGVSQTATSSRRPSISITGSSAPLIAWTEVTSSGSNILVAQWNGMSNSGAGAWEPLGDSLSIGGISQTGSADHAMVKWTAAGPVVSWIDSSNGIPQVYLKRFSSGSWQAIQGSASGLGVSISSTGVQDMRLAVDNQKIALAWTAKRDGIEQVYVREYNGSQWEFLGGANNNDAMTSNAGGSHAPSITYHSNQLFATWQAKVNGVGRVYAARYTSTWQPAGPGSMEEMGLSEFGVQSTSPQLASLGGILHLSWTQEVLDKRQAHKALYSRVWNGSRFVESLIGDSQIKGVANLNLESNSLQLAVDGLGRPVVSWTDLSGGAPTIHVRANRMSTNRVFFVNNATPSQPGDLFAPGDANNLGLSRLEPALSVQAVLDNFDLGPGDMIFVDSGEYPDPVIVDDTDSGVTVYGNSSEGTKFTGTWTISGDNIHLNRLVIGADLLATGSDQITLSDNRFTQGGVKLQGTTGVRLIGNRFEDSGVEFSELSSMGVELIENDFSTLANGIQILVSTQGIISRNRITGEIGLAISAPFTGAISQNRISGSTTGVLYSASAPLNDNDIFGNFVGIVATVDSNVDGLGFAGQVNRIYENEIGVSLNGRMQGQEIFGNSIGVSGSGILGGDDWSSPNEIRGNQVGVDFQGEIRFNRILANEVGISGHSGSLIHHNIVSTEVGTGIEIAGRENLRIFQNTMQVADGRNVDLHSNARSVELMNNIFWAERGHNLYVANDSQVGFFSDFNTLVGTDTSSLVYWTKDFADILDWQMDVAKFDLHSSGTTRLHPTGERPQFRNRHWGDYRTWDPMGGLARTSPSLDKGNVAYDESSPFAGPNLLNSPQQATPQVIDLLSQGWTAASLDSNDFHVVFGGRVSPFMDVDVGRGTFRLQILNAAGTVLGERLVNARRSADYWELVSDRVPLPAGSRTLRFEFQDNASAAVMKDGFVRILSETNGVDRGAYGNTSSDSDLAELSAIALRFPDLYTDWELNRPRAIQWETFGNVDEALVRIDLYQDTATGPSFLQTIATSTADDGEFTWLPLNSGLTHGMHGLRIEVSLVGSTIVRDQSTEPFSIPENSNTFYVNDSSTIGGVFTTAMGDNRNTGKLPGSPKPYPNNVLRSYDLGPGQTLYVDTGSYHLLEPLVISGELFKGEDEGFSLVGAHGDGRITEWVHANELTVAPIVTLDNADFVRIAGLHLHHGDIGLWVTGDSTESMIEEIAVTDNTKHGILIDGGSINARLSEIVASRNGQHGVWSVVDIRSLKNSTATNNQGYGFNLQVRSEEAGSVSDLSLTNNLQGGMYVLGMAHLERIQSSQNPLGILFYGSGSISQSKIEQNGGGIVASGQISIEQNLIDQNSDYGLLAGSQVVVQANVITGNRTGVTMSQYEYGAIRILNNRIAGNSEFGVEVSGPARKIEGNSIYGNRIGLQVHSGNVTATNNLIYDNLEHAIAMRGGQATVVNNTIHQELGAGVSLQGASSHWRNNAFWIDHGLVFDVNSNAQTGFSSDFNSYWLTNSSDMGEWGVRSTTDLSSWQRLTSRDSNSIFGDPLFVDAKGADNQLGWSGGLDRGSDDDFHLQSQHGSYRGPGFAPVLNPATGLPEMIIGSWSQDAQSSALIDRGSADSPVGDEPAFNGGFINIGAYGGTSQASKSPEFYAMVTSPNGGEIWPLEQSFPIRWRNERIGTGTIRLELMRDGQNEPVLLIAEAAANTGAYSWAVPASLPVSSDYRIRVSHPTQSLGDASDFTFSVVPAITTYYVNDQTVEPGDLTTAPGDDANDGLSPNSPKASIQAVLDAYDLEPNSIILLDAGDFNVAANIIIGPSDSGLTLRGIGLDSAGKHRSVIRRGNVSTGSIALEIAGASGIVLEDLAVTNASIGIFGRQNASLQLNRIEAWGNSTYGVKLENLASGQFELLDSKLSTNGLAGLSIAGATSHTILEGNRFHDQPIGVELQGSSGLLISGNELYRNTTGISGWMNSGVIEQNSFYENQQGLSISAIGAIPIEVRENTAFGNTVGLSIGVGNV